MLSKLIALMESHDRGEQGGHTDSEKQTFKCISRKTGVFGDVQSGQFGTISN